MKAVYILIGVLFIITLGSLARAQSCTPCDLNHDGAWTTVQDYSVIMFSFGSKKGDANFKAEADRDHNDAVTVKDWGIFMAECPLNPAPQSFSDGHGIIYLNTDVTTELSDKPATFNTL